MANLQAVSPNTAVSINYYRRSCNVGGAALGDFSIAIDSTRSPVDGKAFRDELEDYFQLPVKYLFLTHSHTDHRNGIPAFKDITIVSSEKTAKHMPKTVRWSSLETVTFDDKFVISSNDSLKVEFHHIGGHTVGSSILYFPSEKVLFAGDLVVEFVPISIDRTFSPDDLITGLEYIQSLDVEKIVPGHSWFDKIFYTKTELNQQITLLKTLRKLMIDAIEDNISLAEIEMPRSEFLEDLVAKIPTLPVKLRSNVTRQIESVKKQLLERTYSYYKK
ncbi:MAG: MBL fold metallo-hydrolase [Candidatus Odinarchaeota archaeon]